MRLPYPDSRLDLEPFFSLSHDYLCIAGYDGYFRKVNPAFIELMGFSQEELFANPISHLVHFQDKMNTAATRAQILEGVPLLNFQNRYVTKSGKIVWLTWTSIPDPDQKLIYAIAKNITHIKELEEERQLLIRDLTSVNSGLKQLSYTIAHDLRTPVSNMISLFGLLERSNIQDKDTLEYLDLLEESVFELKDTLNAQLEQLKDTLLLKSKLEPVDMNEVFLNITDSISSLIKDSRTSFKVDFSEVGLLMVNNFYLHSIFLNLITNSIKFARPGIPPVICISSKETTEGSQILFSDNGSGFDMEKNRNRIFKLHQVFTDHNDSKGVGLFLVKNYMDNLGGSIEVSSEINVGTTFTLTFKG